MIDWYNLKKVKKVKLFPIKFSLFFLLLSLVMFSLSPWEWEINNPLYFYTLNFLYITFIYFGYKIGLSKYKLRNRTISFSLYSFVNISLFLNLLLLYPKFLFRLKVSSLSFSEIINNITIGFLDPATAYAAKHQSEFNDFLTLSNPITLIYFVTLPIQFLAVPLGLFYWDRLNIVKKIVIIIIIVSDILSYVMIGTNKGIFDYIILIPVVLLIKNPNYLFLNKIFYIKNIKYTISSLIILTLGIVYFVEGNKGRKNDNFGYDFSTNKYANRESFILELLPDFLDDSYIALDSYITNGYYAMGLGLELDHSFTYGLGHNSFLISLGEKVLGVGSVSDLTYQKRIEDAFGWSASMKWHTFYVWMANDLSFFGVTFFLFILGYFFSQIWLDSIYRYNPYSIMLTPLFFTIILYLPANNQVLGNQGGSFVFWTLFILWFKTRGSKFIMI